MVQQQGIVDTDDDYCEGRVPGGKKERREKNKQKGKCRAENQTLFHLPISNDLKLLP